MSLKTLIYHLLHLSVSCKYSSMIKKIVFTCCILLSACQLANAQSSWQWGKRGGSPNMALTLTLDDEYVVDMATDPAGNVYLLCVVQQDGSSPVNVDGHLVTGWGDAGEAVENILITSFTCEGRYRWSKDFGTNSDNTAVAIKTDSLGGVYVSGALSGGSSTRHLDSDTSWTSSGYQSLFLVKYDTAGNYKWFRMPEPDTITEWGEIMNPYTGVFDMDVDGGGNCYLLCNLEPGGYAGGSYVVATDGTHILEYDKLGNFIGGTPMQITYTGYEWLLSMKKDFKNGRYYITGTNNSPSGAIWFGGTPILSSIFVGCFNNSGHFLWERQNTHDTGNPTSRAAVDDHGNLYISSIVSTADTFNGNFIPSGEGPVVFKLDSNGNNLWGKYAITNAATFCNKIILNGDEADIAGYYPGLVKWPGYPDSLNIAAGPGGYRVFIARFNANTGAVIGLDSMGSPSATYNGSTAMTSDKYGNFYVGGYVTDQIWTTVAGTIDTLTSIGGYSDFFVAKYGTANCTGPISLETPAQPVLAKAAMTVYPNPVWDDLNIAAVSATTKYSLYNISGGMMRHGYLQPGSNLISMSEFSAGIYILEVTGADGSRNMVKVVKE